MDWTANSSVVALPLAYQTYGLRERTDAELAAFPGKGRFTLKCPPAAEAVRACLPPHERHHTNATIQTPVQGLAHCACSPVLGSLVAPTEFVRRVVPEPDLRPPANAARADPDGPRRDVHHLVWPPIIDAGPPKHVFTI